MSGPTNRDHIGLAVTASAVCLAAVGAALLFAGGDFGDVALGRRDLEPLASLLGGALLGFGAMNWIARASTLGGIYGRAVVVGNQVHFLVGSIVLLKHGIVAGGSVGFWALTGFYVLGAGLFAYLLLGPAVRRQQEPPQLSPRT